MRLFTVPLVLAMCLVFVVNAQSMKAAEVEFWDDKTEIRMLLDAFLEGAGTGDYAIHDRFWAEELIYTSSAGLRFGKQEIMDGLDPEANDSAEPDQTYSADDIQINVYGDTAVLAFRLVARDVETDAITTFLNSGTLRKSEGEWRVVLWQAIREAH
ncbi:MAG: nuclear transport factor 2 family protein [Balneolia bacterium]|nr:nuclear transport factor 2 family protein [Balneolia bacterium]